MFGADQRGPACPAERRKPGGSLMLSVELHQASGWQLSSIKFSRDLLFSFWINSFILTTAS